jgi:hypothetical protein
MSGEQGQMDNGHKTKKEISPFLGAPAFTDFPKDTTNEIN